MDVIVDVQKACESNSSPSESEIVGWSEKVFACLQQSKIGALPSGSVEFTIRIVDSEEMQDLNREYRGKDKPTNVLSFPFDNEFEFEEMGLEYEILGDIIICTDVVNCEAKEQNKTASFHWAHMVTHGILHLLGYDHIEDKEALEMEGIEVEILASMGFPNPY